MTQVPAATPSESVGVRLVRGSGVIGLGNAAARVIGLATAIVAARLLTEEEYGLVGVIQSTLGMFGIAAGLGLGQAATRHIALFYRHEPERARGVAVTTLVIGAASSIATAAVLAIAAPWLAARVLDYPGLATPLMWSTLLLVANALFGILAGILNGQERFGITAGTGVIQALVTLGACLLLLPDFRVVGFVGSYALGTIVAIVVAGWTIRIFLAGMTFQSIQSHVRTELGPLFSYVGPILLAGAAGLVGTWLAMAIIANQSDGYVELGYYTAANRLAQIILFVTGFVSTALLPILADAHGGSAEVSAASRKGLEFAITGSVLLIVPLGTLLVFGGPLVMALFGRSYEANWAVLAPVIARGCVGALVVPLGVAMLAHGRQMLFLVQQIGFGASVLALTWLWRAHGGTGLALAEVTGAILLVAWRMPGLAKMGMLTRRTSLALAGTTVAAPGIAGLAWWCPDEWRLAGAVFFTPVAAVVCLRLLTTLHERRRLWALMSVMLRRAGRAWK